jgi:hypothetical protein
VSSGAHHTRVSGLLGEIYRGDERLARPEIQRRAAGMDLAEPLAAVLDAMPDGEYDRAEATDALSRLQSDMGVWRDASRLPLTSLDPALAVYSAEGQVDDATGHEAGPEEEFGGRPWPGSAALDGDPDPDTAEGRHLRPSPEGHQGPH